MNGRPSGITYSRQGPTPQAGRALQAAHGTPTAAPAGTEPTATGTATSTGTTPGTTYLTINRGLLIAGLLFSIASPSNFGVAAYSFMGMMLIPTIIGLGLILSLNRAWTYITSLVLGL